jgi:hypothetical protein
MASDPPVTAVAVAPTMTTVFQLDARYLGLATVAVQNLDPTQTFSGYIRRAVSAGMTLATSSLPDFVSILPAGSVDAVGNPTDVVVCDVDVEGSAVLSLVGFMSGAGGNVSYSVRKSGPKR